MDSVYGCKNRTWAEAEEQYPTFGSMEGRRWYTVQYGFACSLPLIAALRTGTAFVSEPITLSVRAEEYIVPETGEGEPQPTGRPFTGSAAASFLGKEYPLTFDADTGAFTGAVTGPPLTGWSEDSNVFSGAVTVSNDAGSTTEPFEVAVYRPIPAILELSAPPCAAGGPCRITARIVISTVPESEGVELPFSGRAAASFQGTEYPFALNEDTGLYEASWTAPSITSWHLRDHVYAGTVSAVNGEDTALGSFGLRVLEKVPPRVEAIKPAQDVFLCNEQSPLFLWRASDADSGLSAAEVALDGRDPEPAELGRDGTVYWQMPVVRQGEHTVLLTVTDNDGNAARLSRSISGVRMETERTQADVEHMEELTAIGWPAMTGAQRLEWLHGVACLYWSDGGAALCRDGPLALIGGRSRGAYNAADVNRVELAAGYLGMRVKPMLFDGAPRLKTKTDWAAGDELSEKDMTRYLGNVRALTGVYERLRASTPDVHGHFPPPPELPESMACLTHGGANRIETALILLECLAGWSETVDYYEKSRPRSWSELETAYPGWSGLNGTVWTEMQLGSGVLEKLPVPWKKL